MLKKLAVIGCILFVILASIGMCILIINSGIQAYQNFGFIGVIITCIFFIMIGYVAWSFTYLMPNILIINKGEYHDKIKNKNKKRNLKDS